MSDSSCLVDAAKALVDGSRNSDYGDVNDSFVRIAGLWSAYLGVKISKHDVAYMMVLLKVSRLRNNAAHHDSSLDVMGYMLCADKLAL